MNNNICTDPVIDLQKSRKHFIQRSNFFLTCNSFILANLCSEVEILQLKYPGWHFKAARQVSSLFGSTGPLETMLFLWKLCYFYRNYVNSIMTKIISFLSKVKVLKYNINFFFLFLTNKITPFTWIWVHGEYTYYLQSFVNSMAIKIIINIW